jgi:hypothetical protein
VFKFLGSRSVFWLNTKVQSETEEGAVIGGGGMVGAEVTGVVQDDKGRLGG